MFIKWSIFGFLIKRPSADNRYKQSVLDDMFNKDGFINKNINSPVYINSYNSSIFNMVNKPISSQRLGIDERHPFIEPDQNDTLFKINTYYKKQIILNYLKNDKNSIHDKLESIQYNNILDHVEYKQTPNISKGGLFKDWDFVF